MSRMHVGVLACLLALATPASAGAQPSHCERARPGQSWPSADGVSRDDAVARVATFRRAWRGVRARHAPLPSFGECMTASHEHFVVRRIDAREVRSRLERLAQDGFARSILTGTTHAIPDGSLWEVYWGGGSRLHPPSGAISGYLAPDGRTVVAIVHWPEG